MIAALVLVPALAGLATLLVPRDRFRLGPALAAAGAGLTLVLAAVALVLVRRGTEADAYRFVIRVGGPACLPSGLFAGLDGPGALVVFLIALLALGGVLAHRERPAGGLLLLVAALNAAVVSLDLAQLAVAWTLAVLVAGLVGAKGGAGRRRLVASLAAASLLAVAALLVRARSGVLDLPVLGVGGTFADAPVRGAVTFVLLALAFAVPALAVRPAAPPPAAALLAGALTPVAALGLLRVALPVAPGAARELAPFLAGAGGVASLVAGIGAWTSPSPRRLGTLASLALTGLILLAAAAIASGGSTETARTALVLTPAGGLLCGLVALLDPEAGDGPRRRLLLRGALVALALLPAALLLRAGAFEPGGPVLRHGPLAAPAGLGLALLAAALLRTAARRFGLTRGDVDGRAMLALGALLLLAVVLGARPEPVADLASDAARRILAAFAGGGAS